MGGNDYPGIDRMAVEARDAFVKFWSTCHEAVYRVTGGQLLNRVLGMTVVQLTTKGRRTGELRTTMLTAPIAEDGMVVLVASNGGDQRDPQWFRNILVCPDVSIMMGRDTKAMRAHVAVGSERRELWDRIRQVGPTYSGYQSRTTRELPVVVLEPAPNGVPG